MQRPLTRYGIAILVSILLTTPHVAAAPSAEDLAKAAQNPVASMISLPFQFNFNFGVGSTNQTQTILNIQPVYPFSLSPEWNLITRTIIPLINQPTGTGYTFGVGDINETLFLSPAKPGKLIWGAGPTFTFPTGGNMLTTHRFLLGPAFVGLVSKGPWLYGALVNNQWSVGGDPSYPNVNTFLLQPFVNYNKPRGRYYTFSPVITANWLAAPGQQWIVPLGGGVGQIMKLGEQPVNISLSAYYNVVHPTNGPTWQLRFQFVLLFPK